MSQFALLRSNTPESPTITSNEGGTVHIVSGETSLRRFLILGSGATFYADAKDVTRNMTDTVKEFIKQEPRKSLEITLDVARNRLALKRDPTLYVHALLTQKDIPLHVRREAYDTLSIVAPTGTDLLHWIAFRVGAGTPHLYTDTKSKKQWMARGFSNRGFRTAIELWFKRHRNLPLQAVKYDQRDGWSLRDALRLARPKPDNDEQGFIFQWITHPEDRDKATRHPSDLFRGYADLRNSEISAERAAHIVEALRIPREAIPAPLLAHKEVWAALVPDMPAFALVRNLGKLGSLGLLNNDVAERIRKDVPKVVHPFSILLARETYASGKGFRGSNSWPVDQRIVQALDSAFADSFGQLEVNHDLTPLIALDTSGSMTSQVAGTPLTALQAEAAIASVLAYQFPKAVFVAYSQGLTALDTRRRSYEGFISEINRLKHIGTYCWLPLDLVIRSTDKFDAVVSITDNETAPMIQNKGYGGWGYNPGAPSRYTGLKVSDLVTIIQQTKNKDFRHAVVGLAANNISIANARDPRQMDFEGLSADVPVALAKFLQGIV
jgi:60 kDa SS-A/Ro ribonucleoprotein